MPSTGTIRDDGLVWGQNNKWNYIPGISDRNTKKPVSSPAPAQAQGNNRAATQQGNQKTAAQAQAEIDDLEKKRIAKEKAEADAKIEQSRYEKVSKKEDEKRRKEFETKSSAAAGKVTGGQAFLETKKPGQAIANKTAMLAAIAPYSEGPTSAEGTILGLPKNTNLFTKFGESINRAANLTFSSPQTRFGGM